eukprot:COSAG01_NODE_1016_length_12112_cov_6.912178_3_plen_390_part_00
METLATRRLYGGRSAEEYKGERWQRRAARGAEAQSKARDAARINGTRLRNARLMALHRLQVPPPRAAHHHARCTPSPHTRQGFCVAHGRSRVPSALRRDGVRSRLERRVAMSVMHQERADETVGGEGGAVGASLVPSVLDGAVGDDGRVAVLGEGEGGDGGEGTDAKTRRLADSAPAGGWMAFYGRRGAGAVSGASEDEGEDEGEEATMPPSSAVAVAAAAGDDDGDGGGGGGDGGSAAGGGGATLEHARSCYCCKARYRTLHHFYDQLCPPCASLNWRKRHQAADLRGKLVLVTGGRVSQATTVPRGGRKERNTKGGAQLTKAPRSTDKSGQGGAAAWADSGGGASAGQDRFPGGAQAAALGGEGGGHLALPRGHSAPVSEAVNAPLN